MKLPLKDSRYLWIKDSVFRRFIRWAYAKYLDELYIPEGTKIEEMTGSRHYKYVVRVGTSEVRRGQQEVYMK